ncbi:MAG: MFS transporter [Planctomycetaceae bacterium]|jgi:acyl-[acyl-carrier-protein]-phospholipid O-acyltransferase / long-chain-fatty-acid--[acyl-carrier-protein] ligase|nr:MFS transporter [Planctomycetaceae bacterium]MBT4724986.1 MFS transporter [Planctomycetaceae bacterium]MBT4845077.1 MFS transporter [Planctomycetaceae bacterium]MBT5124617.1 MFS transporter [Planctomycetaceae bacterium]MBT5597771.1 MFS transporter [Planctomycetaceae bacterium]
MSEQKIESSLAEGKSNLFSRSFIAICLTQLFTGINDNTFRWLVIGIAKGYVDFDNLWGLSESAVLGLGLACFVSPYILLSTYAGYVSDRFSKRSVIVGCKIAEILVMLLGTLSIWCQSPLMIFVSLTLMGAQSAMFFPAKMGALPEIVKPNKLSPANGFYNMMTVVGTLFGMFIGSWLADMTAPLGTEHTWSMIGSVVIGLAVTGTIFSLMIEPLKVANPERPFPRNAPRSMLEDIRVLRQQPAMFRIALGIMFFWAVSAVAQNNIDQFVVEAGGGREVDKTPFLIAVVVGVCIGSVLAGLLSGDRVQLGILPIGAFGIAISSMMLFTINSTIFDETQLGIMVREIPLISVDDGNESEAPPPAFVVVRLVPGMPAALSGLIKDDLIVSVKGEALTNKITFEDHIASYRRLTSYKSGQMVAVVVQRSQTEKPRSKAGLRLVNPLTKTFNLSVEPSSRIKWEYYLACLLLGGVGFSAGLFEVPLTAYLQHRSPKRSLGAILAATNSMTFIGMLVLNGAFMGLRMDIDGDPLLSARSVFLIIGALTIPIAVYIVWLIPSVTIKFIVLTLSKTLYRVRLEGIENIPESGGALLVPNHVTWIDGILLLLASERPIRMVVFAGNFSGKIINMFGRTFGVIMITPGRRSVVRSLATAAKALDNGELVCIFPEGALTRSGQIQAFKPGVLKVLQRTKTDVPVIPIYLDGLWGSVFSFARGRYFWKIPKQIPYPVWIHFGEPLHDVHNVHMVRQEVAQLGATAVNKRIQNESRVTCDFVRECKRNRPNKVVDSSGATLSGKELLLKSLVVRRLLNRHALSKDEEFVGLLIPQSVFGVVANMALSLDKRVAVNLNYTVSAAVLNACCEVAGIKTILASRLAMKKFEFDASDLDAELFYVEDLRKPKFAPTMFEKLGGWWTANITSANAIIKSLGLDEIDPNDILTVIFTSGSTGIPKGVMLTHANVGSNAAAINSMVRLQNEDVLLGILPLFHSMGYTVTMWSVVCYELGVAFHPNPLEVKKIGELAQKYDATVMIATPTFLRGMLRRVTAEQFQKLNVVITGAEKLPLDVADQFEEKFDVRPNEGYGATETSPLVSVNIPKSRQASTDHVEAKDGTVGRPIVGVAAKVTDLDTGEELGTEQSGMLWIKGPNIMKGYYGREELTNEVIVDDWYKTGDVALIDKDGFIKITGRMTRFSKIGGEMVPHIKIEECINEALGSTDDMLATVTAVPHPKKGERIVVLHKIVDLDVEQLRQKLAREFQLPNLFIPSPDSFLYVDELPLLGTGKLDLKGIKAVAEEMLAG